MAMAANLTTAATLSVSQASLAWYAATLKVKFAAFIADVSPLFVDTREDDRQVGNWLIPMYALSQQLSASIADVSLGQLSDVSNYLFRICYAASYALSQGRITNAQGVAMLAAWNARFGT